MSDYLTGNPVPSTDPRDLDDNRPPSWTGCYEIKRSQSVSDREASSVRLGYQVEIDAQALVSS